jgi:hypothetical protein
MKFLYLDDSGKIHSNDSSKYFVLGGFSVDEGNWHKVVRQVSGAKSHFFRARGRPHEWEMKNTDFLTANAWNRSRNRGLCFEICTILKRNQCRVFVASLEKARANDALDEAKFFPLAFQRLVAKFNAEVVRSAGTGTVICDWSTHQMDRHLTNCISSLIITRNMDLLRGGVTYGSSKALVPLQVCDLIAGAIRRSLEGQTHIDPLADRFRELRYLEAGQTDVLGYPIDSILSLF